MDPVAALNHLLDLREKGRLGDHATLTVEHDENASLMVFGEALKRIGLENRLVQTRIEYGRRQELPGRHWSTLLTVGALDFGGAPPLVVDDQGAAWGPDGMPAERLAALQERFPDTHYYIDPAHPWQPAEYDYHDFDGFWGQRPALVDALIDQAHQAAVQWLGQALDDATPAAPSTRRLPRI